jgi:hypothetical protein
VRGCDHVGAHALHERTDLEAGRGHVLEQRRGDGLSPSAVAKLITRLEQRLGVRLINRTFGLFTTLRARKSGKATPALGSKGRGGPGRGGTDGRAITMRRSGSTQPLRPPDDVCPPGENAPPGCLTTVGLRPPSVSLPPAPFSS